MGLPKYGRSRPIWKTIGQTNVSADLQDCDVYPLTPSDFPGRDLQDRRRLNEFSKLRSKRTGDAGVVSAENERTLGTSRSAQAS